VLLHLIDATQDDVVGAYETIRNELALYGHGLDYKMEIVALNKCDALGEELAEEQRKAFVEGTGIEPYMISAVAQSNVNDVLYALAAIVKKSKAAAAPPPAAPEETLSEADNDEDDGPFDPLESEA
jgi:GTP-binding protein